MLMAGAEAGGGKVLAHRSAPPERGSSALRIAVVLDLPSAGPTPTRVDPRENEAKATGRLLLFELQKRPTVATRFQSVLTPTNTFMVASMKTKFLRVLNRSGLTGGVVSVSLSCLVLIVLGAIPSGCQGHAGVSVQPGFFFGHDLRAATSVVYVLDLSGSMREGTGSVVEQVGTGVAAQVGGNLVGGFLGRRTGRAVEDNVKKLQQKVEKVKLHLIASLNGLPTGSQFNVVLFSSGVQKLSPVMVPVNTGTVGLVSSFVSRLEAQGSTSLGSAISVGLHTGGNQIIVLTDGLPTDSSPQQILQMVANENYNHAVVVSSVGVGNDQDFSFLRDLAVQNGGSFVSYE